ncbi:LysE family translocator [Sulfurospirillum arcachonense]|uniref:LysE family translocator n=1 Tax=Sulfurospirillum arcachonense TaxID=57666 RepID=UPI00046832D4|nr:LysE family translocator [Sulfurospirillum arcachonense]
MEFILLASAHFLALLSPGPDFFIIIQTALKKPLRYAFSVCAGIASANALYLVIAVLGLEVIKEMQGLMIVLKYLGGAYLVYIGIMLLKAKKTDLHVEEKSLHVKSLKAEFVIGFLSGFLNPKNIIFYFSLFTVMVSPQTSLFTKSLYALWMSSLVLFWDIGVALLIGNQKVKQKLSHWIYGIEKVSGVVLTTFGIVLVL